MPYKLLMPVVALALLVLVFADGYAIPLHVHEIIAVRCSSDQNASLKQGKLADITGPLHIRCRRDDGSHMPALAERSDDRDLGVLAQKLRALKEDAPAAASLKTALKRGQGSKNDSAAVRNAILYHNVEGVLDTLRAIEVLGPMFVELMTPEPAELEQCQWDPDTLEAAWGAIKDGKSPASTGLIVFGREGMLTTTLALSGSCCGLHVSPSSQKAMLRGTACAFIYCLVLAILTRGCAVCRHIRCGHDPLQYSLKDANPHPPDAETCHHASARLCLCQHL